MSPGQRMSSDEPDEGEGGVPSRDTLYKHLHVKGAEHSGETRSPVSLMENFYLMAIM